MATGSGSGTPATGTAATLATLRDRVKTMIMSATGFTEPYVATASSVALAALRDRVEASLADSTNAKWTTDEIDEAITKAMEQYSRRDPQHAIATVSITSTTREIDISSISNLTRVEKVWWDYNSDTPGYPPNWRQFEVWPGPLLYIDDDESPANGDTVRIWYSLPHTIKDLASASATTIPNEDIGFIVIGATHFAAHQRAMELAESLNVDRDVTDRLMAYADEQGKNFRYHSRLRPPAWQRYASAYDQNDLDEALRWALHRYNKINPDRTITTVTLSAAGREVDISSITDYLEIERVWWTYDSSDPSYPPYWRDFEVWPGNLLYVKAGSEPQISDVVRIFYSRAHSINGLDSASSTTLPTDDENLLVIGAAGFAAQERMHETEGRYVPTKLREWAQARLAEFEKQLLHLARQIGARQSGLALTNPLDRWEDGSGWW